MVAVPLWQQPCLEKRAVAEPFADTFLLGDVTVTYDHVQPRLARWPPRAPGADRVRAAVRRQSWRKRVGTLAA